MKAKQVNLYKNIWTKDRFAFGGSLLKGSHPKKKRVFNSKLPLHVVMKSSLATGRHSMLNHNEEISKILSEQSHRHHVKLHSVANAGNHIHILLQAPSREHLSAFLRAITGRIAQQVMGETQAKSFWVARPFSRIVSWGRDHKNVLKYLSINSTELTGMSREGVRRMYEQIQEALRRGLLPKLPSLVAAGFV